jgi:hypothetical protein
MSYSLIDLSENAQDNRYPIRNDFGLLYAIAVYARLRSRSQIGLPSTIYGNIGIKDC